MGHRLGGISVDSALIVRWAVVLGLAVIAVLVTVGSRVQAGAAAAPSVAVTRERATGAPIAARATAVSAIEITSAAVNATPLPPLFTPAPAGLTDSDRADYMGALAARDNKQYDDAIAGFARVRQRAGPLASLAAMRQGQSHVLAGRPHEAIEAYANAAGDADLPMASRVAASLDGASAAAAASRPAEALALLAPVGRELTATANDAASARWQAARLLRDRGDVAWTAEALRALDAAPGSTAALSALDTLEAARVPVPNLTAAYVRYRARQNDKATALYRAVVHADGFAEDHARAWFYLGALAERAEANGDAILYYGYSAEMSPAGPLAADAHWWRGSLLASHRRYGEAIAHFDAIAGQFPGSQWASQAELQAAVAAARAGNRDDAGARLRRVMNERGGTQAAEASRWLSVLGLRGSGDPPPSAYDPWSLAALLEASGRDAGRPLPPAAQTEWDASEGDWAEADSWMRARYGEAPADATAKVMDDSARLALVMDQVGEHEAARAVLRQLARGTASRPHESLVLARAASVAGLPDVAMGAALNVLGKLPPTERLHTPWAIERLAYPIGFPTEVYAAAQQAGVPPFLLLALVRQESAFEVRAGSTAGAMGLTQVIAPTGKQIATQLREPWSLEMLMEPSTSLRFGAYYLGEQIRLFDGNVIAALAAYNAGPGAAARWLRQSTSDDADGFVAAIDYAETRLYVERVLENYAHYRYVYGAAEVPRIR